MSMYKNKEEVILVVNHDVEEAISVSGETNYGHDGCILARAAHIIPRYV